MRLRRVAARDIDPREYIDGANEAFGHWGDIPLFTWVFRGGAEILFLDDEQGRVIAGSGITWRTLQGGQKAAIMTGSWTRPEARGHGAFSRMVQATIDVAAERNAVVLGFVRAENASARILEAAGAAMHPTYYCRSTVTLAAPGELEQIEPDPAMFRSSFVYTPSEWRAQFLERPNAPIECIGRRGAWSAVVERAPEFDRLHALSDDSALPQLAARAAAVGRRLFWFTARRPAIDCEWTDGFLAQWPAALSEWDLQNGDRT
jgi:GNAT superfamily N-acetyltransferase